VLLRLHDKVDDVGVADEAANRGIGVRALSPMFLDGTRERGLLLGYGRSATNQIDDAVSALSVIIEPATCEA
jgi:GntR family transcriptional regulator / MocR family aminotransferase